MIWFGKGAFDALGEGEADFFVEGRGDKGTFWVNLGEFDVLDPVGKRLAMSHFGLPGRSQLTTRSISR